MLKICITGAGGNIASYLISSLVNGSVFPDKKNCSFLIRLKCRLSNLLNEIHYCRIRRLQLWKFLHLATFSTNSDETFKSCDLIIFLGGFPRKEGTERSELLKINNEIFSKQAESLIYSNKNCKSVVIANPCNTNAKILLTKILKNKKLSEQIDKNSISFLSRLDHNRANYLYLWESFKNIIPR